MPYNETIDTYGRFIMKTVVMLVAFALTGIYVSLGFGYNAEAVEPEQTIQVADGLSMPDYWNTVRH